MRPFRDIIYNNSDFDFARVKLISPPACNQTAAPDQQYLMTNKLNLTLVQCPALPSRASAAPPRVQLLLCRVNTAALQHCSGVCSHAEAIQRKQYIFPMANINMKH